MNSPAFDYIVNRLSLRKPQIESLEILNNVSEYILNDDALEEKLRKIKMLYPSVKDFDREFPSLCFTLATGVGKTRLMGAFVAYLYIVKNIKNFIIIAPNITIYNKLKSDFSQIGSDKYVFKGLKEFVQANVNIVTGENYKEQGRNQLWDSDITINIFNIDKINKEEQSIKSLSEYLGESYYDFLINQKDLVVLMDESHHYRADRGMKVINELKPLLGLELTATPQIEKNGKTKKFNNIIYDYPLSKAMIDGYVKEPSVATKKNFNPSNFTNEELDFIKINDGIAIHENTKTLLEQYAHENDLNVVKPFVMVVCRDIDHANTILNYIKSDEFCNGKYKNKVMMITSKDKGIEKDENIQRLLLLEHPLNNIEIVVHVNMLKEGWDVNNLYTIIPLRVSASQTLTEQTMGRGLRLPYGKRTGVEAVDRLTIVSHDKYQAIIDAANDEKSILKASNIMFMEDMDLKKKESIVAESKSTEEIYNIMAGENNNPDELLIIKGMQQKASQTTIGELNFNNEKTKDEILSSIKFDDNKSETEVINLYNEIVEKYKDDIIEIEKKNRINIPYVSSNHNTHFEQIYCDFELDYSNLDYKPLNNEILITHLGDKKSFEIKVGNNIYSYKDAKEILMERLMSISNLDYESCMDILNSKVDEYLNYLNSKYNYDEVLNIIYNYSNEISNNIAKQILSNIQYDENLIEENCVKENYAILSPSYIREEGQEFIDIHETVDKSNIKNTIFNGFKKSYHTLYKFDSSTEKDFAIILENSNNVKKWLRPAPNQFNIYWNGHNKYEPDFIVETDSDIYMVEVKASNQIDNDEVVAKRKSAEKYCNIVNDYGKSHNMKKWLYITIPDSDVKTNYDFDRYIK